MKRSLAWYALQELKPFEGRLSMAWRTAAVCALASMLFMTYQVPLASIGCYLIMFLAKPSAQENILIAIAISVLVSLVVLLILFLTQLAVEVPMWRLIIIALGSYFFLYLGAASLLGDGGNIVALVIGFIMTLLPFAVVGEVATRGILYAWLMVLIPMGVIAVFHIVAGRSSSVILQQKLAARLMKLAEALEYRAKSPGKVDDPVNQELIRLLRTGDSEMQNSLKLIRLFHLLPSAQSNALQAAIMRSQAMLIHLCAALLFDNTQYGDEPPTSGGTPCSQSMQVLAGHLRQLARLLHNGKLIDAIRLKAPFSNDTMQDPLFHLAASLFKPDRPHNKAGNQVKEPKLEPSGGFFKPDAFTNPNYSRFALKTTAAAILAYIIYTSIQWDGIHTAMITCYVAALGTTGETVHKLVLRITGCLIGAALGMASLAFLMPHMTSITQLVALVFLGILLSAWVSSGSERISYAGIQVGLAFLMTVLQGFGPDVQMSVATDRIYGILLGNALLFIAFTQIWPVTVVSSAQDKLGKCRQWLERWEQLGPQPFEVRYRLFNQILDTLEQSREELVYNRFEPKKIQASDRELRDLRTTIDAFERQAITLVLGEAIISPAALSPGHGGLANAQIDHAGLDAESCMRPGTIPGQ